MKSSWFDEALMRRYTWWVQGRPIEIYSMFPLVYLTLYISFSGDFHDL